jgi:threonine/homoserine/homoserine lactone efflux protein
MDERVQTALSVNRRHGATSAEKAVLGIVLVLSVLMIMVLLGALLRAPNLFQP